MILFRVASHIQLISALIVRLQTLDEEADLHLMNVTDFTPFVEKIRLLGLFRRVELTLDKDITSELYKTDKESRMRTIRSCPNLWNVELDRTYETFYMGHDAFPNKLFYYYLLKQQKKAPDVYFLEDGLASYTHDIYDYALKDDIPHEEYGADSLLEHVRGQYLYRPTLYQAKQRFELLSFPPVDDGVRELLLRLYGRHELPKEKYIVFTACFAEVGTTTNELDLVNMIADRVGKENIAVKMHPRAQYNPYTPRGYHVVRDYEVPWEAFLLDNSLESKVLISPSSYSVFTAHSMFGLNVPVIFLARLLEGNFALVNDSMFSKYISSMKNEFNEEMLQVFVPKTEQHLDEVFRYIRGRWN